MTTTSSFQKYPDYYNSIEDCDLFIKNYNKEATNPRYKNFKQVHFTAGDEEQFQKYLCNQNGNGTQVEIIDNLFFKNSLFLQWDKYKNLNNLTTINTFKYIFEKFKKGIYVKILNNELKVFLPFSNINFINEWSSQIKIDPKYQDITEFFKYITETDGYIFNKKHINNYINTWYSNNCLLRYEYPVNEGDTNISAIKNMFDELCQNRKLPDIEFFINRRDFPILSKNGYEPYYHLWNSLSKPLISHNYDKYLPILSMSSNENFSDILIPTYEDWIRVQSKENKFFPKSRQVYDYKFEEIPWKDKKPTAVFRGSSTGEGVEIDTNQRLKVVYLSHITKPDEKNIYYLDAGITKWNLRPKKLMGYEYLQVIDINSLPFGLSNKLSPYEQSKYKYIIHIDGHVSAFRLSYELSLNSVILLVKSKWNVWFSHMLKPYIHYVPVKEDLSDLIVQIKWCRDNDEKCIEIINNSKCFYNTYLQKNSIFDYFQKLFVEMKNNTGIYFKNTLSNLDIQHTFQTDFLLNKKYINDIDINRNIHTINTIPHNKRTQPLLFALQRIINFLNIKLVLKNSLEEKEIIFNNKLCKIKKVEYIGYDFIIKSTDNKDKIIEHIHEAFIGINVINNIIKNIPNFAYIFDCYEDKETNTFNIVSEYVSNQNFQAYIMSEKFKFTEFLNIILQICLALEVAQENCCFVHNDLTPWNICLKYLNEPTYIDYKIKNKVISIKTSIIPIIIDYGKSHIIYNNQHYGIINMFKSSKSFDMLSIFITSVYQLIKSQVLTKDEFIIFLKLSNFISNTKYCNVKFRNSKDVKTFFYSAKKYTNLVNSNKYELENYTPIHLFNYIVVDLKFNQNQNIKYTDNFNSFMNVGNSTQIVNYIFSTTKEDKIKSYINIFKNIKNINFTDTDVHPLFLFRIIYNLKNSIINLYDEFQQFCINENIKNISRYNRRFNNALIYLEEIKFNNKNIYFTLNNINNNSLNEVQDYNEKIFLDLDNVLLQLRKNNNIKGNIENLLLLLNLKNIVEEVNLYSNIKLNKNYFISRYESILSLDKENILNKIANIKSLEYYSKILYNENISKINGNSSISHLNYCNQLKEIINLLR